MVITWNESWPRPYFRPTWNWDSFTPSSLDICSSSVRWLCVGPAMAEPQRKRNQTQVFSREAWGQSGHKCGAWLAGEGWAGREVAVFVLCGPRAAMITGPCSRYRSKPGVLSGLQNRGRLLFKNMQVWVRRPLSEHGGDWSWVSPALLQKQDTLRCFCCWS